ncbi:MAG: M23 family metallopeptidase [Acidobacteriota bacterium]|nr:M23 family metallopeptidase [Acidobacteriota bacterium]
MRRNPEPGETGVGRGAATAAVIIIVIVIGSIFTLSRNPAPSIKPAEQIMGIGLSRTVNFIVRDPSHRITAVDVEVGQNGKWFKAPSVLKQIPAQGEGYGAEASAEVGRRGIPDLRQGRATIRVMAHNNSWGRFFRGGLAVYSTNVPVRFMPPQVEVLTTQHYINLGGCDMVVFNVSPGTVKSGVEVGSYFFRSFPVTDSKPLTRLAIFAFPYDVTVDTPAHIAAWDDAGNKTIASFTYRVFPAVFKNSTINVDDAYMQRVVPPILSQTTAIQDQGNLLENYVAINRDLRKIDKQRLIQFGRQTNQKFMWTQPFLRLPDTKLEANFADHRTYLYNGKVIDHEVHLGYDLASVEHSPVEAANDGQVIFAGWFDIFGNAVIIDHGCGLQTLYGHMASFKVKAGELVKRGQVIGMSDSTGLAGGDHVHFGVYLDGIPVVPKEWWDPHWIHDRIMAKLQHYQ